VVEEEVAQLLVLVVTVEVVTELILELQQPEQQILVLVEEVQIMVLMVDQVVQELLY
jgi:hypothetical protein